MNNIHANDNDSNANNNANNKQKRRPCGSASGRACGWPRGPSICIYDIMYTYKKTNQNIVTMYNYNRCSERERENASINNLKIILMNNIIMCITNNIVMIMISIITYK